MSESSNTLQNSKVTGAGALGLQGEKAAKILPEKNNGTIKKETKMVEREWVDTILKF